MSNRLKLIPISPNQQKASSGKFRPVVCATDGTGLYRIGKDQWNFEPAMELCNLFAGLRSYAVQIYNSNGKQML